MSILVEQLHKLAATASELRVKRDEARATEKAASEAYGDAERALLQAMTKAELERFASALHTFTVGEETSVPVPQGPDRVAFFDYLKERGIFDDMATVNSQTLNSWVKKERELADERKDPVFAIPGLTFNPYPKMNVRKK